jgi:surface protein
MINTFSNLNSLTSLDLSTFNTENVILMSGMFRYDTKLNYLNIKN